MARILLGVFLGLHGLIHLGYAAPAPADPNYPFRLNQSWLITNLGINAQAVRSLGMLLSVITVICFVLSGLATLGIVVPQNWWQPLTLLASVTSLALLILFWHSWLVLGVLIDVALLVVLLWAGWQPFSEVGI
jgi:hypothetical protein